MRKNQTGFAHVALLGIIVLVLVAGVGMYVMNNGKKATKSNSVATESETSLVDPLPADILTVDKIKELAVTATPNVALNGVQLKKEAGVLLYKVKFANGTVVFFNALTGAKVTRTDDENKTDETEAAKENAEVKDSLPSGLATVITFDKAREIALATHTGTILKIELETENGKVVYSARFSDAARVDIDATTGAVVRSDPATTSGSGTTTKTSDDTKTGETSGGGSGHSGN